MSDRSRPWAPTALPVAAALVRRPVFSRVLSLVFSLALTSSIAVTTAHAATPKSLETISERSGFRVTGRYDEVERLCAEFVKAFPNAVRSFEFGRTPEGRPMLALAISTSGALTPDDARERGIPVMVAQGGIHAG